MSGAVPTARDVGGFVCCWLKTPKTHWQHTCEMIALSSAGALCPKWPRVGKRNRTRIHSSNVRSSHTCEGRLVRAKKDIEVLLRGTLRMYASPHARPPGHVLRRCCAAGR